MKQGRPYAPPFFILQVAGLIADAGS